MCGQTDLVTGLASNSRPETLDGERVIGLFVNTLPFRMKLAPGSWEALVQSVFAEEKEMMPHRFLPLSEIVSSLGGQTPYEAVFNFTHFHVYRDLEETGNESDIGVDGGIGDTNFPLLFELQPGT